VAITGCYDLRLTCDNLACKYGQNGRPRECTFAGDDTGAHARTRARRHGWKLDVQRSLSVCPACAKAGVRTRDVEPR
jgi:hypothetical protein